MVSMPNPYIERTSQHKGLKSFYESGSAAGVQPHHAKRLRMLLTALETAQSIEDMDIPGFRLHQLKGEERGRWSVWVNGNWRVTFEFKDGHAYVLNYEDDH
jgi:proteic killer suppression protein